MARPTNKQAQASQQIGFSQSIGLNYGFDPSGGDLVPLIAGPALLYDLRRMSLYDDTVGGMMWCINSTLSQCSWGHVPQVDGKDNDEDPEAIRMADFADTLLVDMAEDMHEHMESAVNMVWAGFAPHEIILKQRNGGEGSEFNDKLWGIKTLAQRDPLSIVQFLFDPVTRDPISMVQVNAKAAIPLWKVCNYRTSAATTDPFGIPLLMPAWKSWRMKIRAQETEAIAMDREMAGLPVFRAPESLLEEANERESDGTTYTSGARAAQARIQSGIAAVKDMRFNRSGGLFLPSDTFADENPNDRTPKYDFKLVTTAGQRSIDMRTVIRDYDRSIARTVMMQFLHLGDRSGGSYAMSDDQSSMAMKSLQALTSKVCTEFRRKALRLVWQVNGLDPRYMPRLKASDISKEGMTALGTFLRGVGAAQALWDQDSEARREILEITNLHGNRAVQEAAAATAASAAKVAAQPKAVQPTLPGLEPSTGTNP